MHRPRLLAAALGCALMLAGCGETQQSVPTPRASESTVTAPAPSTPRTAKPSGPSTPSKPTKPAKGADGDGALVPEGLQTGAPADGLGSTNGRRLFGADVSWPQCPKGMGIPQKRSHGAPMPTDAARFVIIGLTNGPSFTPNPCLTGQLAWARDRKLLVAAYAVISWPRQRTVDEYGGTGSRLDQLRNVGRRDAAYNIATMRKAGFASPIVWMDIEPVPDFDWEGTTEEHAALIEGAAAAYREAGLRVGVYSTPSMYRAIAGGLRLGAPEWRAAGQTSMQEALSRCGRDWSIQGGQGIFGQWVEDDRDRNVSCPGIDLRLAEWFVRA